jgi:hypothetical protein
MNDQVRALPAQRRARKAALRSTCRYGRKDLPRAVERLPLAVGDLPHREDGRAAPTVVRMSNCCRRLAVIGC